MDWYYATSTDEQVLFQETEFQSLIDAGKITEKTLIWNKTMDDWRQAGISRPDLFAGLTSATTSSSATSEANQPILPTSYSSSPQTVYQQQPPAGGLAVTSLVCGILGLVAMCILPIVGLLPSAAALICGLMSKKQLNAAGDEKRHGLALTGIILGIVGLVLNAVYAIVMVLWFGFLFSNASSF